jgi:DNA-binding GntR family transcriptional regulator
MIASKSSDRQTLMLPVQRHKTLHEQTYQMLRASILAGELAPGGRLVETQLAEQLNISRTPIREALRQLQQEELIEVDASGSLCVATFTATDAIELYDCRIALEQLSIAGACQNITPLQLEELKQCVETAKVLKSSQTDSAALLQLDYRFHRLIAEGSGNRWLVSLLDRLFDKMALMRAQTTRHNPEVLNIYDEHQIIYEAIAQHDLEIATKAIVQHLNASKLRVAREMQPL